MPPTRLALGLATAIFALAAGISAASAATAYASSTVNIRAGAGTGYPVVGVLRPGQPVEIDYCRGAWCLIEQRGPSGWVNANFLSADSYRDDRRYDDRRYYGDDDYYDDGFYLDRPRYRPRYPSYRSEVCMGGSNAAFCFGN